MKLTIIRHIAVEKAYKNAFNGQIDVDMDFCEIYSKKFLNLKNRLKDIKFDEIYSSNLKRTIKTLEYLGFSEFKQSELISEIAFKFEGKRFEEIDNVPADALESTQNWIKFILLEDIESFRERINSFLCSLNGQNILICTHEGVIKMLLSILQKEDFYKIFELKIDNLDMFEIEI